MVEEQTTAQQRKGKKSERANAKTSEEKDRKERDKEKEA